MLAVANMNRQLGLCFRSVFLLLLLLTALLSMLDSRQVTKSSIDRSDYFKQ